MNSKKIRKSFIDFFIENDHKFVRSSPVVPIDDPTLLFTNNGFTNISVLKELFSSEKKIGQKFGQLNLKMQQIFVEWSNYDIVTISDRYIDLFDSPTIEAFHKGIEERYSPKGLLKKIHTNVDILEKIGSEIFRLMSTHIYKTSSNLEKE